MQCSGHMHITTVAALWLVDGGCLLLFGWWWWTYIHGRRRHAALRRGDAQALPHIIRALSLHRQHAPRSEDVAGCLLRLADTIAQHPKLGPLVEKLARQNGCVWRGAYVCMRLAAIYAERGVLECSSAD